MKNPTRVSSSPTIHPILWVLVALATVSQASAAAPPDEWKQAESFFQRKLYDQAEPLFTELQQNGPSEWRVKATLRATECDLLSGRIPAALKRAWQDESANPNSADKALLALLRIKTARYYLTQTVRTRKEKISKDGLKIEELSEEDFNKKIDEQFLAIYSRRDTLRETALADVADILNTDERAVSLVPNVWNFAVETWAGLTDVSESTFGDEVLEVTTSNAFRPSKYGDIPRSEPLKRIATLWREIELDERQPSEARQYAHWRRASLLPHPNGDGSGEYKLQAAKGAAKLSQVASRLSTPSLVALARSRAGEFYEAAGDLQSAVAECRTLAGSKIPEASGCHSLVARAQSPELELHGVRLMPETKANVDVRGRNVATVHWQVISTSYGELESLSNQFSAEGFRFLRYPDPDAMRAILKRKPAKSGRTALKAPRQHAWADGAIAIPALPAGLYVLIASNGETFKHEKDVIQGTLLTVTDRAIVASVSATDDPESPAATTFYTWNTTNSRRSQTGEISLFERTDSNARTVKIELPATPESGRLRTSRSWAIDALYRDGDHYALLDNNLYFAPQVAPLVQLFFEIDRKLYRPGQKMLGKLVMVEKTSDGWKLAKAGHRIALVARDAQGEKWKELDLSTTTAGMATFELAVPEGRMLGDYSLEATFQRDSRTYRGNTGFSVETYKRSQIEVTLQSSSSPLFNRPYVVEGRAKYYSSQPVAKTKVEWKFFRSPAWWQQGRGSRSTHSSIRTLIDSGATVTDAAGGFRLSVTPKPARAGEFAQTFEMEVSLVGADASTVTETHSFTVGTLPGLMQLQEPALSYQSKNVTVPISVQDASGGSATARGELLVERAELTRPGSRNPTNWQGLLDSPDAWSPKTKIVKRVPVRAAGKTNAALGTLPPGIYLLSFTAPASKPTPVGFIAVVDGNGELPGKVVPTLALRDKAKYRAGDTARITFGAKAVSGQAVLEVWAGARLVQSDWVDAAKRTHKLKIPADAEGGMTVRWYLPKKTEMLWAEVFLPVSYASKELVVEAGFPKSQKPGTKATISLRAGKQRTAGPIYGTVRVVDAALDALRPPGAHWLSTLYPTSLSSGPWTASATGGTVQILSHPLFQLPDSGGDSERSTKLPSFHWTAPSMATYDVRFGAPMSAMAEGMPMERSGGMKLTGGAARLQKAASANGSSSEQAAKQRSDFSETALFLRDLQWAGNSKDVSFQLPDTLTRWKAEAHVYNSRLQFAETEGDIVATKPFNARLSVPRIYREQDKAVLSVELGNETGQAITGEVTVAGSVRTVDGALQPLRFKSQHFRMAQGQATSVSWPITIPIGARSIEISMNARGGAKQAAANDGEKRLIAVLPSKTRIVRSQLKALPEKAGDSLVLESPIKDSEVTSVELSTLSVFPLDMMSLADALPGLRLGEGTRSEEIAANVVPLGVLRSVFRDYPELRKRLQNLPLRKTELVTFRPDDERRLLSLEESPWLHQAMGGTDDAKWISLLAPEKSEELFTGMLKKLESLQSESGGWPWIAEGRDDVRVTAAVLAQLAQLKKHGQLKDSGMAIRGLRYLVSELRRDAKSNPATGLMFAGLFIDFDFRDSFVRDWIKTQVDHWKSVEADPESGPVLALSPLQRLQVAALFQHQGPREMADLWMARVFEQATDDELTGLGWTTDSDNWRNHRDSIADHAAILSKMVSLRPEDPRTAKLARWLLWSRYAQQWPCAHSASLAFSSLASWFERRRGGFESPSWTVTFGTDKNQGAREVSSAKGEFLWTEKGGTRKPSARVAVRKPAPGIASLTSILLTKTTEAQTSDALALKRTFYLVEKQGDKVTHRELENGQTVPHGSEVMVEIEMRAKAPLEFLHVHAPRGSGFEPVTADSGWRSDDELSRYLEVRDGAENAFVPMVEKGKSRFFVYWRATLPGQYAISAATAQGAFTPAVVANSDSFELKIDQPLKLDQARSTPKSQ